MAVVMVRTNASRLTLRAGGQVPVADLHAPDPGPPHRLPRGPSPPALVVKMYPSRCIPDSSQGVKLYPGYI